MGAKIGEKPRISNVSGVRKTGLNTLRGDLKRFTRERLIIAAMDSFATDGFRATTVERIVDLAGTTTPTFYRHFASKSELLQPLQQQLAVNVREAFLRLDDISEICFDEIRPWIDGYSVMWKKSHQLCVAYWEAAELDSDLAADAIPSSLISVGLLEKFLTRFTPVQRRSVELRLALTIPLLDRVMQVAIACREPGLKERLFDEFAQMLVLALQFPAEDG